MPAPLRYLGLCLAALVGACGETGPDPAAPEPGEAQPTAALAALTTAPALRLDAHSLYYCYHTGTPTCVVLTHQVRIRSSGAALQWTASKSKSWIILSAASGTTSSTLTISVDPSRLPSATSTVRGLVTIAAAGASNSPQTILVEVNGQAPPALAFSDSTITLCYHPGSIRICIVLAEDVRITSTGAVLAWRAVSSAPWIVLRPTSGTTPTTLHVEADLSKVPPPGPGQIVTGSVTMSSGAARNSPQVIPVSLYFYAPRL